MFRERPVSESPEDLDLLIDEYLDDRMEPEQRKQFEERMGRDPELRDKVMSATRSVDMVKKALDWVTPNEEFDDEVSSKIVSITQSNMRPPFIGQKQDPDAKLIVDPEAAREKRRLILLAVVAAVIFALAAAVVVYVLKSGSNKTKPNPIIHLNNVQ
jgi:anti-sigma factor RsiW